MQKEKKKTTVLVCGGFHSRGIAEKLKSLGISHAILTSRFTKNDCEQVYLSRMLNEETPFQKFLARKGSRLAPILILQARTSALGKDSENAHKRAEIALLIALFQAALKAGGASSDFMAERIFKKAVNDMLKDHAGMPVVEIDGVKKEGEGFKASISVDGTSLVLTVKSLKALTEQLESRGAEILKTANIGGVSMTLSTAAEVAGSIAQEGDFNADAELAKLGINVEKPLIGQPGVADAVSVS